MKLIHQTNLGKLYLGDSQDLVNTVEHGSVDLIFTDPPYPKIYFNTYEYLAKMSPILLKDGGSLITIIPHYNMPKILELFKPPLKWRWLLQLNQFKGSHPRMAMGIEVTFKPMGWWVKNKLPVAKCRNFVIDGIELTNASKGQRKELHKWEQDIAWCEYYISKLTYEDDLVLDPYIGSGTVAVACEKLNRRWIGVDIDEESINTTIERIKNVSR